MEVNSNFSIKAQQDYKLVLLAIKGNQKAYADLLVRYKDTIFFMLLKMVNNKSDAEDLTIEAFGKAFKNIHQYTPNFAFSTWLFKIATNNCIDYLRKRKADLISLDVENENSEHDSIIVDISVLDPEEKMIQKQKTKLMRTIVAKLKPRYRQLIELRYFDELSYEEIAEKLDLPIGTVKAQLFRARELLYNVLKNSEEKI